ncbi:uncharacterized protein LTR77_001595 [Saxophila tyrrhenica]|uniref:Zn(2)-C6 fungal-type domain-containing protein n=1 Tax=Saxophila tyrrhenica TaxID=1690608 RepID=A0AAV9PLI5_9PEZI|nr:hypothetical protein LTR77_001595 [Saxophila tyrrhenica]
MVGVPRSLGCFTCRKRKVACDQSRPTCKNCQKRGVECGGYAKYSTVLQWTPNGLKKRQRFEEVVGRKQPSQDAALVKSRSSSPSSTAPAPSDSDIGLLLPAQAGIGSLVLQQLQTKCYETYLPPRGEVMVDVKETWMYTMNTLTDQGNALSASFAALSLARMGVVTGKSDLVAQGRGQYAIALTGLKRALYDPDLAFQDRTLAAMRTLSIYEILSPTYSSVPHGKVHEHGMAEWCRAAGPRSIKTDFAMQLFKDVRWTIMNHCIETHKASILGSEEWLTLPWERFEKDSLQKLYDFGFDISTLLQLVDSSLASYDSELLATLPMTCFSLLEGLDLWRDKAWPSQHDSPFELSEDIYADTEKSLHNLSGMWEATNMIYYWWFKILLNEALSSLQTASSRESSIFSDGSSPENSQSTVNQYADLALTSNILTLAADIVRASPYLLADNTGWVGPQRLAYPLKAAMKHLARARSPLVLEAQASLKALFGRLKPSC